MRFNRTLLKTNDNILFILRPTETVEQLKAFAKSLFTAVILSFTL